MSNTNPFGPSSPRGDQPRAGRKPRQLGEVNGDWETETTKNMNSQELYKHREDIMQEQDLALDKMLESAKRQRQIGEEIGTEAKSSIDLIKRIDKSVESEDGRIRATSDKVDEVEESSSTKWFWLVICLLTLALIGTVIAAVQT